MTLEVGRQHMQPNSENIWNSSLVTVSANIHLSPSDSRFFGLRIYSVLTVQLNLTPLSGVKLNRQLKSSGKSLLRDNPMHLSRPTSGWRSKLCLRVILTSHWLLKLNDLDTDGMNAAPSLESSETWAVDTRFCTRWVTELCECVRVVSSMKFPNNHTQSVLALRVFHTESACAMWNMSAK